MSKRATPPLLPGSSNGRTPRRAKTTLELQHVAVQWTAVYKHGDDPIETVVMQPFTVPARDWPNIVERIEGDLSAILARIVDAGGWDAFQQQELARQAQQQQAPPG